MSIWIKKNRVVFNEVTKDAVVDALSHPRKIDQNLVKSQKNKKGFRSDY